MISIVITQGDQADDLAQLLGDPDIDQPFAAAAFADDRAPSPIFSHAVFR